MVNNFKDAAALIWIDLEMTGLDPYIDEILEIAAIVTRKDLKIIDSLHIVINQPKEIIAYMNKFCESHHYASGLISEVYASNYTVKDAEEKALQFLNQYCYPGVSPLCGNSIGHDKEFLRHYMPELFKFFNHKIIDVTSIELFLKQSDSLPPCPQYQKPTHRALEDIQHSIAQFKTYLEHQQNMKKR